MSESPLLPPSHPDPERHSLFMRMQALQDKYPETIGAALSMLLSSLTDQQREALDDEAVQASPGDVAGQEKYKNERLITANFYPPHAHPDNWRRGMHGPNTRRDF